MPDREHDTELRTPFLHFCWPNFMGTVSFKRWWGIQLLSWLAMHKTKNHGSYSMKEEDTAN